MKLAGLLSYAAIAAVCVTTLSGCNKQGSEASSIVEESSSSSSSISINVTELDAIDPTSSAPSTSSGAVDSPLITHPTEASDKPGNSAGHSVTAHGGTLADPVPYGMKTLVNFPVHGEDNDVFFRVTRVLKNGSVQNSEDAMLYVLASYFANKSEFDSGEKIPYVLEYEVTIPYGYDEEMYQSPFEIVIADMNGNPIAATKDITFAVDFKPGDTIKGLVFSLIPAQYPDTMPILRNQAYGDIYFMGIDEDDGKTLFS